MTIHRHCRSPQRSQCHQLHESRAGHNTSATHATVRKRKTGSLDVQRVPKQVRLGPHRLRQAHGAPRVGASGSSFGCHAGCAGHQKVRNLPATNGSAGRNYRTCIVRGRKHELENCLRPPTTAEASVLILVRNQFCRKVLPVLQGVNDQASRARQAAPG